MLRVDLGCGTNKPKGFVGVDTYPAPGVDIVADLNQQFPFSDNSVDELRAYDVIEHLFNRIHTMNEIWRICKPGAKVDIFVPSTDGRGAFQDPTHVSFWNINSFLYYCVDFPHYLELCTRYGFKGAFKVLRLDNEETFAGVIHIRAELNVVKTQTDLKRFEHKLRSNNASEAEVKVENKQGFSLQLSNDTICKASKIENHFFPIIEPIANEIDRPLWSVMIPTYNGTEYLEQTLRSVLEQDPGSELMQIEVVDDCSTQDDPEELVRKIGQGRVSFYRQPKNLGLIGNWNDCIRRAHGHWVHILHQDDVVKFGFYRRLQTAIEKEPTIGAAFCRYFYMERGCEQALSPLERETPGVISNWIERIAVTQRIECPSIVVKREVYEDLGGYCQEAYYAADWEMWKRIAAYYSFWYEPELLACYRLHLSSESSRLVKSGANIADTRKAIEISESYLPITIAAELSNQARENCAFKALNIARRMLSGGEMDGAIAQMREGIKSSQSSNVISSVLELVQELAKSNQHNVFPINALDQLLSAFQEPFQKQQETALIESLKLKDINLIIFPDWEQSEELLYQDLTSVITSLVNHPNKNRITLLIHTGNLSEDEASLFLSDIVMNLLMQEDLNVTDEPEISLIGQLSVSEWEVLLPRLQARIILENENQSTITQIGAKTITSCELDKLLTNIFKMPQ